MATKAQHGDQYAALPPFLRRMREAAGLTQRELGDRLTRPQSWVYNCETGNRRVDVTEFVAWARGCGVDPGEALARLLEAMPDASPRRADRPPGEPPARRPRRQRP